VRVKRRSEAVPNRPRRRSNPLHGMLTERSTPNLAALPRICTMERNASKPVRAKMERQNVRREGRMIFIYCLVSARLHLHQFIKGFKATT
jgi:hypothetical protein